MHDVFYGKYNGIYRACANRLYQASPRGGGGGGGGGGEGPGDEARIDPDQITHFWYTNLQLHQTCEPAYSENNLNFRLEDVLDTVREVCLLDDIVATWTSLVPRQPIAERENSLVNCLYRFGSNILKLP